MRIFVIICRINGVPACANKDLLTGILRDLWQFKGFVVSDAGAIDYMRTEHNYRETKWDTVVAALTAGVNLELSTKSHAINQNLVYNTFIAASLPPANEVCESYVFTDVCLSTGVSVQGGFCPEGSLSGGLCPGGLCPGVSLSREVSLSRGVSVWEDLCSGISVQGGLCQGNPPNGNVQAVCILLECILVSMVF